MLNRSIAPASGTAPEPVPQPRAARHSVLVQGQVLMGSEVIWCAVSDLSSKGAKILFGEPTNLPPQFELLLVHQRMRLLAEVRWQKDLYVGVGFLQILSPKQRLP